MLLDPVEKASCAPVVELIVLPLDTGLTVGRLILNHLHVSFVCWG